MLLALVDQHADSPTPRSTSSAAGSITRQVGIRGFSRTHQRRRLVLPPTGGPWTRRHERHGGPAGTSRSGSGAGAGAERSGSRAERSESAPQAGARQELTLEGDGHARYTAKKGNRYYAVIYEGVDPTLARSGAAGTAAPASGRRELVTELVKRHTTASTARRAAHGRRVPDERWLPAQRSQLKATTFHSYESNIRLHVLSTLAACPSLDSRLRTSTACMPALESGDATAAATARA